MWRVAFVYRHWGERNEVYREMALDQYLRHWRPLFKRTAEIIFMFHFFERADNTE